MSHHIGVGIADYPPEGVLRYEGHHGGPSPVALGQPVLLQVGVFSTEGEGVEVQVEAERRIAQVGLAQPAADEPLAHAAFGQVGVVGGVGGLGQDVQPGEQPGSFVITQVADVADAAFAEQLGGQQGEDGLQRRDAARPGPAGLLYGGGQVQLEQLRQEQEQAGDLGAEAAARRKRAHLHVGDSRDFRAILGVFTRPAYPGPGQALPLEDAEQVGLADRLALVGQALLDVGQGQTLAA